MKYVFLDYFEYGKYKDKNISHLTKSFQLYHLNSLSMNVIDEIQNLTNHINSINVC